jgi:hypothetical protein
MSRDTLIDMLYGALLALWIMFLIWRVSREDVEPDPQPQMRQARHLVGERGPEVVRRVLPAGWGDYVLIAGTNGVPHRCATDYHSELWFPHLVDAVEYAIQPDPDRPGLVPCRIKRRLSSHPIELLWTRSAYPANRQALRLDVLSALLAEPQTPQVFEEAQRAIDTLPGPRVPGR